VAAEAAGINHDPYKAYTAKKLDFLNYISVAGRNSSSSGEFDAVGSESANYEK